MIYTELESILLAYPDAWLSFPFDKTTAVFKVSKKMFALVDMEGTPLSINLKCNPNDAQILRSQFAAIIPGYHMNKDHWNTVILNGSLDPDLVKELIENSYLLVVKSMSKKEQHRLDVR
ncbi:MAG: MmcQ/YjbR family DNA-binding protein [Candidatus Marinimicrobia bacterium]|nr:MmcQ/YjbR family DNA-binding protein [Candidatus Neomarinimicrobiota bacterium]MCF7922747.1 MmcQ/YjbR family DNA-binding protein [Candidatus Neomarinimicrobiota bacterium]